MADVHATASFVEGFAEHAVTCTPMTFIIHARDAQGGELRMGGSEVRVTFIGGPTGGASGQVEDLGNGRYRVQWEALLPGTYAIYVTIDGTELAGCPLVCRVANLTLSKATLHGEGCNSAVAGELAFFTVSLDEETVTFGQLSCELTPLPMPCTLAANPAMRLPAVVVASVHRLSLSSFRVEYLAEASGMYRLHLSVAGQRLANASDEGIGIVRVRAGAVHAPSCELWAEGARPLGAPAAEDAQIAEQELLVQAGAWLELRVRLRDRFGNAVDGDEGCARETLLSVGVRGPEQLRWSVSPCQPASGADDCRGLWQLSARPTADGEYALHVAHAQVPLPGSPLLVRVLPERSLPAELVMEPAGPLVATAGVPARLLLRLPAELEEGEDLLAQLVPQRAGWPARLARAGGSVAGGSVAAVARRLARPARAWHLEFVTCVAGAYALTLRSARAGEQVAGSPLAVTVLPAAVDARSCVVLRAPTSLVAGSGCEVSIEARDRFSNRWQVGGERGFTALLSRARRASLADADPGAGWHGDLAGAAVNAAEPKRSAEAADALPTPRPPGTCAQQPRRQEEAAERWSGICTLEASDMHDGRYVFALGDEVFHAAGEYRLEVLLRGERACGAQHALPIRVSAGGAHAPACRVLGSGLHSAQAHTVRVVDVVLNDKFGNRTAAGDGVAAHLEKASRGRSGWKRGSGSGSSKGPVSLEVTGPAQALDGVVRQISAGRYRARFTLPLPGWYALHLALHGQPLGSSPFAVEALPRPRDAAPPIALCTAGAPTAAGIAPPASAARTRTGGPTSVRAPLSPRAPAQWEEVAARAQRGGLGGKSAAEGSRHNARSAAECSERGKGAAEASARSHSSSLGRAASEGVALGLAAAEPERSAPGMAESGRSQLLLANSHPPCVHSPVRLLLLLRDGQGVPTALLGGAALKASVRGPAHVPPLAFERGEAEGELSAQFAPPVSGSYSVAVTLGGAHACGSPLQLHVQPHGVHAPSCRVDGLDALRARAGEPACFEVEARDMRGELADSVRHAGHFSGWLESPAGGRLSLAVCAGACALAADLGARLLCAQPGASVLGVLADCLPCPPLRLAPPALRMRAVGGGRHRCSFTPMESGSHSLRVFQRSPVPSARLEELSGSPFVVNVSPAEADARTSDVQLLQVGVPLRVGSDSAVVLIRLRDRFGNRLAASLAAVHSRIVGPGEVESQVAPSEDGALFIRACATAAGVYAAHLTLAPHGEQHLKGSPLSLSFVSCELSEFSGELLSGGILGQELRIAFVPRDSCGNQLQPDPRMPMSAHVRAPLTAPKAVQARLTIDERAGAYNIAFLPVAAGAYEVSIEVGAKKGRFLVRVRGGLLSRGTR